MIDIDDNLLAIWFVTMPPYNDFFAGVSKPGVLLYRFRYSKKEQPVSVLTSATRSTGIGCRWAARETDQHHEQEMTQTMAKASGGERLGTAPGQWHLGAIHGSSFAQLPFARMKIELDAQSKLESQ